MRSHISYAIIFALLALGLVGLSVMDLAMRWPLLWLAGNALWLAIAYAINKPGLLGKKANGSMHPVAVVLLLPYFLLTWITWHLVRLLKPQGGSHEVAPGLWLGRRPLKRDIPPEVKRIVDLTAEFPAARPIPGQYDYHTLPILDAQATSDARLAELARRIAADRTPTLIHCASGHGRSAMLMACVLVLRDDQPFLDAAIDHLRSLRPGVKLNKGQRDTASRLLAGAGPDSSL